MSSDKPPTRRRWLRRSLRGVVVLVLVVLVLPSLLADSYVRRRLEAAAAERLGARVTLGSLSVGWWSQVEVESLLVHEPGTESGVLLASDAVEVDTGLLGLLFGSAPLRVTVLRPTLSLQARDGRLNLLRLVDDLPAATDGESEKSAESTLPSRGVDVRIEGGRVEIGEGPTMATYALDGGVACEALDAAPLSCHFELVRAEGGWVTLDGSIAGWNESGSSPVVTGSLEASRLDLGTLAIVLESTASVQSTGVVDHLLVSSEVEAASTRLVFEADVAGLSVATSNAPFGPPLERVSVRLGGQLNGSALSSIAGSITLPQGNVTLDPESRVTWSAAEIDGAVRVRGVVDDLARLQDAIAGLLPKDVDLRGRATINADVAGRWDQRPDIAWTKQLEQISGSLEVTIGGVDAPSTTFDGREVTELILQADVKQGRATVREGRAKLDGGTVTLGGTFGILQPRRVVGDALTLTVTDVPFSFDQALEPTAEGTPRRIATAGNLGGNIVVTADGGSRLKYRADLRGKDLSRDLVIGTATSTKIPLPALALSANGVLEGDEAGTVRISAAKVTGTGLSAEIANLTKTGTLLSIGRAEAVLLPDVLDALLLGSGDDPMFRPTGETRGLVTDLSAPIDEATGEFVMKQVAGAGEIALAACTINDLDGRELLCSYEIRNRAVHVLTGFMMLSGGTVTLFPGTLVGLGPEQYPFRVNAEARGVQIQEGLRTPLSVLNPLFLADPNAKETLIEGKADLTADCGGAWSRNAGWSESITGTGEFKLTGSTVRGSALLGQLTSSADGSLSGSTARAVLTVLGESGKVGNVLARLSKTGYAFDDIATALVVRGGRIQLQNDIIIRSKDLHLKLGGSASLQGELDYRVETDLVARLKDLARKKLKDDPGGGLLGKILGAASSLSLVNLVTAELGVTVTGNALQGTPAFAVGLFEPAGK